MEFAKLGRGVSLYTGPSAIWEMSAETGVSPNITFPRAAR